MVQIVCRRLAGLKSLSCCASFRNKKEGTGASVEAGAAAHCHGTLKSLVKLSLVQSSVTLACKSSQLPEAVVSHSRGCGDAGMLLCPLVSPAFGMPLTQLG